MKLFATQTPTPVKATLSLMQLEAREVPAAMLDLTTLGASGTINGAIFQQYDAHANPGNGAVQSFLRLDQGHHEQGYNTSARPLQYDESSSLNITHSIKVSDLPIVTIGGHQYAQLALDVNEPTWTPMISLDQLQLFVSTNSKLTDYNSRKDTLGGLSPVYDLDAKTDRWVKIDANLDHQTGTGDVLVDIPVGDLPAQTKGKDNYLYLYSQFGTHNGAGGQYEEWGPGFAQSSKPATTPTPPASTPAVTNVTITGTAVYLYGDGSTEAAAGVTIFLYDQNGNRVTDADGNYVDFGTATTDANGNFTFTVPAAAAAKFELQGISIVSADASQGKDVSGLTLDLSPQNG